jgi:putative transposase
MDFMHDMLADGRSIRVLTVIDIYSRECLALVVDKKFTGGMVAKILSEIGTRRGQLPGKIRVDNGTEFTSKALDHWAYWNHVELDFSRPGKPSDNAYIEAFNASVRRECLSQHWFINLGDAQRTLAAWRQDYNNVRPHSALNNIPPVLYRTGGDFISDLSQPRNLRF